MENDVINQHKAVEDGIDEDTAVAKMLCEEIYSNEEVVVKNTTETMYTEQHYDVHNMVLDNEVVRMVPSIDLDRTASSVYYARLDSRAASEVNGVKTLEVNNLVKATEVSYYRKDNWDQCKFEDPDHRMVTTIWNLKIYQTEVFVREAFKIK